MVTEVITFESDYSSDEILRVADINEKFSEHPLGKAIVNKSIESGIELSYPQDFIIKLGKGVTAEVNNSKVLVGNLKLISDNNVDISNDIIDKIKEHERTGKTVMIVSIDNKIVGLINVADKIKETTTDTINNLYKLGIENIALLTGDNKITDNVIAAKADIALLSDDISKIPELFILSKKVFSIIKINIVTSMVIDIVAVILVATGFIDPVVGALIHNVSSILVVLNSSTLIKFKPKIFRKT